MTREEEKRFLQGYAAALADMVRHNADRRLARTILKTQGISLQKLVGVGVNPSDLARLRVPR